MLVLLANKPLDVYLIHEWFEHSGTTTMTVKAENVIIISIIHLTAVVQLENCNHGYKKTTTKKQWKFIIQVYCATCPSKIDSCDYITAVHLSWCGCTSQRLPWTAWAIKWKWSWNCLWSDSWTLKTHWLILQNGLLESLKCCHETTTWTVDE